MSNQRTLEQKRAEDAWNQVTQVKDRGKLYAKEYNSLARGSIAYIQINGLGQVLAFWRAKNEAHHHALYEHVSGWVCKQMGINNNLHLLEWIVKDASSEQYRRATTEAIAYLMWIKRFAEAELPKGEE